MIKRKLINREEEKVGSYFLKDSPLEFYSSGCVLLDCVLGGGYPLGRVTNIVGDKSTGKTLLAIEACRNFLDTFPEGEAHYIEAEAAFDRGYAEMLGFPKEAKLVPDVDTVEALFEFLYNKISDKKAKNIPRLIIIDSLDALSDIAEKERDFSAGSYGSKPKKMSELFRRLVKDAERTRMHTMIISQIRDNVGVRFGNKQSRSGGHAMDFYAAQILWLKEEEKIYKVVRGVKRPIGIWVMAKCKKNKIGLPYRECEMPIKFAYGIDDVEAAFNWINKMKKFPDLQNRMGNDAREDEMMKGCYVNKDLKKEVMFAIYELWNEIETDFLPTRRKYD